MLVSIRSATHVYLKISSCWLIDLSYCSKKDFHTSSNLDNKHFPQIRFFFQEKIQVSVVFWEEMLSSLKCLFLFLVCNKNLESVSSEVLYTQLHYVFYYDPISQRSWLSPWYRWLAKAQKYLDTLSSNPKWCLFSYVASI